MNERGRSSELRRSLRVEELLHLPSRVVRIQRRVRAVTVPSPLVRQMRLERTLQHLYDVFPKNWEELPAVEITARSDVQPLRTGMW